MKINKKCQISLEYLLIFISILGILGLFLTTTTTIYNKDKEIIKNKDLQNLSTKIQNIINIQELQASKASSNTNLRNIENIILKQKNRNSFYIINIGTNKKYLITSNLELKLEDTNLKNKKILVVSKQNNIISINLN